MNKKRKKKIKKAIAQLQAKKIAEISLQMNILWLWGLSSDF
jgi:hypothetical protein